MSKQLWDDDLGFAIFAPTAEIAPVDKAIYALRDVVRQPKRKVERAMNESTLLVLFFFSFFSSSSTTTLTTPVPLSLSPPLSLSLSHTITPFLLL